MKHVSELEAGDEFGPIAGDGRVLQVIAVRHAGLRGDGGGLRNLYDVTDDRGRTWRTGGTRMAGDCYGWRLVSERS